MAVAEAEDIANHRHDREGAREVVLRGLEERVRLLVAHEVVERHHPGARRVHLWAAANGCAQFGHRGGTLKHGGERSGTSHRGRFGELIGTVRVFPPARVAGSGALVPAMPEGMNSARRSGIGGIGMSALARFFLQEGHDVSGYDKTRSALTDQLSKEGASIHFEDMGDAVAEIFSNNANVLVVYTPAIPAEMGELFYFNSNGYRVLKRAQLLGEITKEHQTLAVAGTHGKTTTSCMLAHVLDASAIKCNAFLGGISTNFNSNYKGNINATYAVVEADEFDRSFLNLSPFASTVTTTDADHLDIYGDSKEFDEGFKLYARNVSEQGILVVNESVELAHKNLITYGWGEANDYQLIEVRSENGVFMMDISIRGVIWENIILGLP